MRHSIQYTCITVYHSQNSLNGSAIFNACDSFWCNTNTPQQVTCVDAVSDLVVTACQATNTHGHKYLDNIQTAMSKALHSDSKGRYEYKHTIQLECRYTCSLPICLGSHLPSPSRCTQGKLSFSEICIHTTESKLDQWLN